MRILVLGGTDLTLHVLDEIRSLGLALAGGVYLGNELAISYAPGGVQNLRHADLAGWYRAAEVPAIAYTDNAAIAAFARSRSADFCLVAGWYHMVPKSLRDVFPVGCCGIHASLLPRLRGGAPLNWAILTGQVETGVTLFALGDGVDDGPVYGQAAFLVNRRATIGELVQESWICSARLVRQCLPDIASGALRPRPQEGTPSYCLQRRPEDSRIDWRLPASELDRVVRASSQPYGGAFTKLNGETIRIWKSGLPRDFDLFGIPGQIARLPGGSVRVVTGNGSLEIVEATNDDGDGRMEQLRRGANQRLEMF